MGVMAPPKPPVTSPTALKRRSGQVDFSNLGPLKTSGTVGFSTFRDKETQPTRRKKTKKSNGMGSNSMDADSDEDDDDDNNEILGKMEDVDTKYDKSKLGPEDARFTGELAAGVDRIRVCSSSLDILVKKKKNKSIDISLDSSKELILQTPMLRVVPKRLPSAMQQHHLML